jgi:hypothetical protein
MATNITPELKTNRAAHLLAQNVTKLMESLCDGLSAVEGTRTASKKG